MSNKLFDSWTWHRKLPYPFDTVTNKVRTDIGSVYNRTTASKSTLHGPLLSAIQAYAELELNKSGIKGAIGVQNNDFLIGEYPSHKSGETHVAVFCKKNGKFYAGAFTGAAANPEPYVMKENGNSGAALFFAIMPILMEDHEFAENYSDFLSCVDAGYSNMVKAEVAAFMLCDNVYRRIEGAEGLSVEGVKLSVPKAGNIQPFTPLDLEKHTYSPTGTIFGEFEVMKPGSGGTITVNNIPHKDFIGKYQLSERIFTDAEKGLIPSLPEWYIIPPEVEKICQHIKVTTSSKQPMRNGVNTLTQ